MTDEAKAIFEKALQLSTDEKLELVSVIMESLEEFEPELTAEQIAELKRRDELYRDDPSRAIPGEQVFSEALDRMEKHRHERETRADAS